MKGNWVACGTGDTLKVNRGHYRAWLGDAKTYTFCAMGPCVLEIIGGRIACVRETSRNEVKFMSMHQ